MTHLGPTIPGAQHCGPIEHTHEDKHRLIEEIAEIVHRYWMPKREELKE